MTQSVPTRSDLTPVLIKFRPSDLEVLAALKDAEPELNRTALIRRAIRLYARKLGVTTKQRRKR